MFRRSGVSVLMLALASPLSAGAQNAAPAAAQQSGGAPAVDPMLAIVPASVQPGGDSIAMILPDPPTLPIMLTLTIDGASASTDPQQFNSGGRVTTRLRNRKLVAGETLRISIDGKTFSPAVRVPRPQPAKPVLLQQALLEGQRAVLVKTEAAEDVKVQVFVNGDDVTNGGRTFAQGGERLVDLNQALRQEARVTAVQTIRGVSSDAADEKVVQPSLDWGRVRAQFWAGTIVSRDDSNDDKFSKVDPYVALTILTGYRSPLLRDLNGGLTGCVRRTLFNTDVDFRLASTGKPKDTENQVTSARSVLFRGVVYAPIRVAGFGEPTVDLDSSAPCRSSAHRLDQLFVAPVFVMSLESPIEDVGGDSKNQEDLYEDLAFGVRVGHYRLSRSSDRLPETINYVTFALGKPANFAPGKRTETGEAASITQRPWAFLVEARLRIPGLSALTVGTNYVHSTDIQDLRLIFGTTFDVSSLVQKLITNAQ